VPEIQFEIQQLNTNENDALTVKLGAFGRGGGHPQPEGTRVATDACG
jgi:hypothetical protein